MKRILIPIITIALASVLVAQVASDNTVVRPRVQRQVETLKSVLGLDDNQIQQLQDLRQSTAEANRAFAEQIREQRQQLRELRTAGSPDPTRVGTIVNEIDSLLAKVRANREQGHDQAVNLINSWGLGDRLEQLQSAAAMMPALGPAQRLGLLAPGPGNGNRVQGANFQGNGPRARGPRARMGGRGFGPGPDAPPPPVN